MIRNQRMIIAESNGGLPVNIQDQTTPALIIPMLRPITSTTITADTVVNTYTITVASAAGLNVGDMFRIIDVVSNRFYQGTILNISGTTITTDAPFDFVYLSGSEFATGDLNMAIDGSVTPQIYKMRIGSTSIPAEADITRLIIVCETNGAVDLNKFGDIAGGLARGIVFRAVNGTTQNVFLVKTNKGFAGIAYDFTVYSASNPSQGINGFALRLTFNGQSKIGVALRVGQADNLEMWVQDDLSSLVSLNVVLEGHATTY